MRNTLRGVGDEKSLLGHPPAITFTHALTRGKCLEQKIAQYRFINLLCVAVNRQDLNLKLIKRYSLLHMHN